MTPTSTLHDPRVASALDAMFSRAAADEAHVRDPRNGYQSVTFPVEDGMEISCRL
ncbi:hypothetical protein OH807_38780 [Kitasatospora sp. NBC_01560]|uniref:hypothetical protein n=1 Tax=Kitasatospora sp. NBC_01560 TaxID=2975965 RepID=UPI0038691824